MSEVLLDTNCGTLVGISEKEYNKFLGIRYATANRFESPEEVTEWKGEYQAKEFGAACFQRRAFIPEAEDSFYYKEFRKGLDFSYSEDCQYLNIWAPKEGRKLPVILYIHGGAFQGGSGNDRPFDGQYYAKKGIIFVTCNYRLGPLGFAVSEDNGLLKGNFGLLDQLTALKWLAHNIESFGGDPSNITLMGQSAGAMSIQQLVLSPLAKPYISKAIMTSGGGIGNDFAKPISTEQAFTFWEKVRASFVSKELDWRTVSPELLFSEVQKLATDLPNGIAYLSPMIDGQLISWTTDDVAAKITEADIPYLLGTTKDDMLKETLYHMSKDWVTRRNKQSPGSSWQFYFARNLPGDDAGSWHSSELWYTIGALEKSWRPMTAWDFKISSYLMQYLVNFVNTGNPNGQSLPEWLNTEELVLQITDSRIESGKLKEI